MIKAILNIIRYVKIITCNQGLFVISTPTFEWNVLFSLWNQHCTSEKCEVYPTPCVCMNEEIQITWSVNLLYHKFLTTVEACNCVALLYFSNLSTMTCITQSLHVIGCQLNESYGFPGDHQQNAAMFQYYVHLLYLQSVSCSCIIATATNVQQNWMNIKSGIFFQQNTFTCTKDQFSGNCQWNA